MLELVIVAFTLLVLGVTPSKRIVFSAHNQVFCQLVLSSALIGHPLSELLWHLNINVVHPAFILLW